MIVSRLLPKSRLLNVAKNPRSIRSVSEPVYDAKGYAQRPLLATLSEYWFYAAGASLAAFMYLVMSSPLSEITPSSHQKYHNAYSDKWNFLYPELENYVKNNYEKLKQEKVDVKIVITEVYNKTLNREE